MLEYHLDRTSGILSLEPRAPLTARDFDVLSIDVDGYLATHNTLAGNWCVGALQDSAPTIIA